MKIAVAGVGYVGLVTAVTLADVGHDVICLDVDKGKLKMLKEGISPIYEYGLEELMLKNRECLEFTDDVTKYSEAQVIIIGVGTPEKEDGSADLSAVFSAADSIADNCSDGTVVVVKSTVPIGTCESVRRRIGERRPNLHFFVVSNPEFLSQGTAVRDTFNADRIVIGADDEQAYRIVEKMYAPLELPIVHVSVRSSEMIKYASNDFLALKISYINEIANFCEIVGADIEEVARGMGMDRRIGSNFLKAGIGYGGSCFPKDTKALNFQSDHAGVKLKTVKATIDVNREQRIKLIDKARRFFPTFRGVRVAIIGLTFKPGTDDLREAPAKQNIDILLNDGADIIAWDPLGAENFRKRYPNCAINFAKDIDEALTDADVCLIMTEWEKIVEYPLDNYKKYMRRPLVFDGRNCYKLSEVEKHEIFYDSIGRKIVDTL